MSENLTKLAHKIDFFKDESEGKGKPASEGEKEEADDKQLAAFMPSLWPWDAVRNHLKSVPPSSWPLKKNVLIIKGEKKVCFRLTDGVKSKLPGQQILFFLF